MIDNSQFHLKRFTRKPQPRNDNQPTAEPPGPKLNLNTRIREYVNGAAVSVSAPAYLSIREIPTSEEISVLPNGEGEDVEVPANQVVGPWQSKQKYLSDHYALLREDAVTPLRNVVSELKAEPWVLEKDSIEHSYIYEKVGSQDVSVKGLRSPLADTKLAGLHCWVNIRSQRRGRQIDIFIATYWEEDHLGTVKATDSGNAYRHLPGAGYVQNYL